jgi:hypothetical protein
VQRSSSDPEAGISNGKIREDFCRWLTSSAVTELQRSHDTLRATLRIAGKRLSELNRNGKNDELLKILRRELKDARCVRKDSDDATRRGTPTDLR